MDPEELRKSVQETLDLARLKELAIGMKQQPKYIGYQRTNTQSIFEEKDFKEFGAILSKYEDKYYCDCDRLNFYAIPEEIEADGKIYPNNWRIYSESEFRQLVSNDLDKYTYREGCLQSSKMLSYLQSGFTESNKTMEDLESRYSNLYLVHPLYLKMDLYFKNVIEDPNVLFTHDLVDY